MDKKPGQKWEVFPIPTTWVDKMQPVVREGTTQVVAYVNEVKHAPLIAAAPEMVAELAKVRQGYINLLNEGALPQDREADTEEAIREIGALLRKAGALG